jgi:surfactin synthase thioesterase subunit/acyl carrier protein
MINWLIPDFLKICEQFDMGSYVGKDEALDAIRSLVTAKVASITKASSSMITGSMTFKNLGVDSLMAIQLRNQLEAVFNTKLAVTNFWKHPSITDFANFLYKKLEETVSIEAEHDNVSEVKEGNWFVKPSPNPNANIKLFCFHDAGGSSSLYQGWAELLDDNIELIAVELPGRGSRMAEQTLENMSDLADKLSGLIEAEAGQKPFVFFGHSMGGAVLLEVTRKLRDYGLPFPLQLFTSSTPALDAYNHQDVAYEISEEELISRFPHLSSENIEDEELRQLFIKIIRADLKLLTNYSYDPVEPFDIPIISIRGTEDDRVSLSQITGWQKVTIDRHKTIERKGGHRYIEHDAEFLTSLINKTIKEKELIVKNQ